MKIGFYGGTFNPIHLGHLNLAVEMLEKHHLDEVWFCPARLNPLKKNKKSVPIHHRYKMVEIATESKSDFKVIDIEKKREGPSYTFKTLQALKEKYPDNQFYLILGDDSANEFLEWKMPEKIIETSTLLIGSRNPETFNIEKFNNHSLIYEAMKNGLTQTTIFDVSSTEIRNRLEKNKYCIHLLHQKVMDYISQNSLY